MITFEDGAPLSNPSALTEFEAEHGIKLPKAFKEIVLQHDGAYLIPSGIRVFDAYLGRETEQSCDLLCKFRDGEMSSVNDGSFDGLPSDVIVFGMDGGGWAFGFDYRADKSTEDPPIVLYIPEYEDEDAILPVAKSFAEMLSRLEKFE